MNFVQPVADAINSLHSNIWSLVLIAGGCYMAVKGHPEGAGLIAAGLAIFKTTSDVSPNVPPSIKP
jgi:hypothetical protein